MPHALSFAARLGCSADDARDALQDALARLAATRDDAPTSLGIRVWLCREVHKCARTRLRSERRRRAREVAVAVPGEAGRADSATAIRDEVEFALTGLDEDERVAVQLRYLHDLDYKDIANVLGASEGACRQRVHKALVRLRARLGGDAAALVAAMPLPLVQDPSAVLKGAMAKATAVSAASGGVVVMATTAQKVVIVAIAAAALGIGGTLTVQRAADSADSADPADPVVGLVEPTREVKSRARDASRRGDAVPTAEVDAMRARIAELEQSLAAAREKADDLDAMDPMAVLVYSRRPIAWKAKKLLEIAEERPRWAAMGKVAQVLAEKEGSGREFLEALKTETDPAVIGMLGLLVRSSLDKTPAEDRRAFLDVLRTAPMAETRTAAANAMFMSEQFRGGFDEKVKTVAKEMNGYLIEALRTEASPEVVGQIARNLDAWSPPPEAMGALKSAAERLPPSPGRRMVWEAIARGTVMSDRGMSLFQQFQAATAQDLKDDIAAGIARAGNSFSGGGGGGDAGKRVEEARARFRIVFGGTSDAAVRKVLLRAALYGLGCVEMGAMNDEQKADAARFFREIAALESDAKQREKIEKVAAAFEQKGMAAYSDYDKIMAARE